MSSEDSTESRQNNEFEALEAIYGEDLTDLRGKLVWNKWKPLNFKISLDPLQSSKGLQEVFAKVDLHIICDSLYPNSVPEIKLENGKGLSNTSLILLKDSLEKKANDLKGEEMIFQLAQHVQEFLHCHNKPASKSFYDEMLQRQKEKEERDLQAKLLEEDRQRQFIQQEVQRRQEILKSETRLWHDFRRNSVQSNDDSDNRQSFSNNSESSDDLLCDHKKTIIIDFAQRQIKRGQCLRHCNFNHTVFIGIDVRTGEVVLLSEWIIKNPKQLATLEQEFNYLLKLKKHPNLIHYTNFKQEQRDDKTVVYILKEHVIGPNCSFFMNEIFNISVQCIKYISKGVLTALDYLHRNNVVHKDIREGCVYITQEGQVLLSNYSLHRRLTDISTSISTNYTKKNDIYKFGIFILALIQGAPVSDDENVDIPNNVAMDLNDFLAKCLEKQERERWTATQLLSHRFLTCRDVVNSPAKDNQQLEERNVSPDLATTELSLLHQSGQSRIDQEFEFIDNLGKGAFGDVMKARNNLDGRYYAIKRIKLNPKNRQLNKKIVREVKLLSRLNHENIVRYYNSWIERTVIKKDDNSERSESTTTTSNFSEKCPKIVRLDEFTINDNIEDLAPSIRNVEVSITYDSISQANFSPSSDDSSSDDDVSWGNFNVDSDSDGIEFEKDTTDHSEENSEKSRSHPKNPTNESDRRQIEFMYIQMEFCEKSTLRNAIDNSVYLDKDRVWRLFREIVEGLAHIHQQGMIHRDLKPVNIFLDSYDHVKIGDFGLATNTKTTYEYSFAQSFAVEKEDTLDESKTGLIGTALYVAPELSVASKANYNQKVDIYSLGIIFFEMCYRPLATNMERISILSGLRKTDIVLPEDFPDSKQEFLIKWLLNHDISKRPTSQEVLQSERVPPPILEECELRELVRHTLSNPQLKGYKYLVASCFDQTLTPVQDITYDRDPTLPSFSKPLPMYEHIKGIIVKIFKQHGAQNLSTPLLMPKSHYYENAESCVKLMTHFGGIVSLPHDLRVPFARYIAWNGLNLFRRYSIERVYREKKVFGFSPRELYECAFDIVTPTPTSLIPDAEIIYAIFEIINELPGLKNKQVTVRLNHTLLMKAILLHSGIREKHQEVLQKFLDTKEGKLSRIDLQNYLITFGLSDNSISTLTNTFSSEIEISKSLNQFQYITRKKSNEASHLAKQALQDLRNIAHNAEAFGVTFEMVVAPGVIYNIQQYSGMICQFVCELKRKHKHGNKEVLAAGGRYDAMITTYRKMMENVNIKDSRQSAVGISLSLDKLVQAVMREQNEELPTAGTIDVAVCSVGTKTLLKEKTKILRSLWSVGIRSIMIEATNIEEIQEQCAELKVPHVIMLKDTEQGIVRVRSWERERFQEKAFKLNELIENVQRIIKIWKETPQDLVPSSGILSKTDSKVMYEKNEPEAAVIFVTIDKLSANTRKRYEIQVRSHLDNLFKILRGSVVVLAVTADSNIIRTIVSYLEWENDNLFHKSVQVICERHQRHKKYVIDICDEIHELKLKKVKPTVILFSLLESFHRSLL